MVTGLRKVDIPVQSQDHPVAHRIRQSAVYFYPTKVLGNGAGSTVFAGYFHSPHHKLAVKVISGACMNVYKKEISIWMRIEDNVNIVRIRDFLSWKQKDKNRTSIHRCFIAMEMALCNLYDVVLRRKTERKKITKYLHDACKGLAWLG